MPTATEWLDLDGLPLRQETFRFDVLDQSLTKIGELAVDQAPHITNDVNRPIRRTLDGLVVPPRSLHERDSALYFAEDVDAILHRVRPMHLLPDGTANPLGIFLWANKTKRVRTFGEALRGNLVDQCLVLEQRLIYGVGYQSTNITTALTAEAAAAGFTGTRVAIDVTTVAAAGANVWAAGRDTRLKVMEDLCLMAGFLVPYFDNDGILVCRSAPNLATATATVTYGPGSRVVDDTIDESDDLLDAPNIYVAIDTAGQNGEVVGTFSVPASAPHSYANRGFYVPQFVDQQGLADVTAANAAAAAAYAQDSSTFKWRSFASPIDSRHDTFDIVEDENGDLWREQSWSMDLRAGGLMEHQLRGIY